MMFPSQPPTSPAPDGWKPEGQAFHPGEILSGAYEILDVIGVGGMGQVYEAQDLALGRKVAIKATRSAASESLRTEAQALAAIRHPGVSAVYTIGEHAGVEYVVMERVLGKSLADHMAARAASETHYGIGEALDVLIGIADALAVIHDHGIVHRDIKPGNVMLAPRGRLVIVDFGLFLPESSDGELSGTPAYMAPETIGGCARGTAGDLYAFGVLAFQLIAGVLPFDNEDGFATLRDHVSRAAPDLKERRLDCPHRLADLVKQLMSKDPEDRPPDMHAVLYRLREIQKRGQVSGALSVLVVDDAAELRRYLRTTITRALPDAEVRTVESAELGLREVRERTPDVLILDLQLPRMNGIELLMYLRGARLAEDCLIVAISAGGGEEDVLLLRELGVSRFIRKEDRLSTKVIAHLIEKRTAILRRRLTMPPPEIGPSSPEAAEVRGPIAPMPELRAARRVVRVVEEPGTPEDDYARLRAR